MKIKTAMSWVIGIASISLVILVLLIIFGNLSGNTGITTTTTITYTNESGFVNTTGFTPAGVSIEGFLSYTITQIGGNYSVEDGYYVIPATNYTQTGNVIYNNSGTINLEEYGYLDAGITYTATYRSSEYLETEEAITDTTTGFSNFVKQIPTIFLFVGIGLLLFVLVSVLGWVIRSLTGVGGDSTSKGIKGNLA